MTEIKFGPSKYDRCLAQEHGCWCCHKADPGIMWRLKDRKEQDRRGVELEDVFLCYTHMEEKLAKESGEMQLFLRELMREGQKEQEDRDVENLRLERQRRLAMYLQLQSQDMRKRKR